MPVRPTYPGVYIEEIPSGVRTITGVATSITAFVGRTQRGPVDTPVTLNSYGDFERIFGGLWPDSALPFAVRDFFLNGGGQAVVVRLYHLDDTAPITKATLDVNGLLLEAKYDGSWGNSLLARVDHDVVDSDAETLFNLFVRDSIAGQIEVFRNVSVATGHVRQVGNVLKNESRLVQIIGEVPKSRPAKHPDPDRNKTPPERDIWARNSVATNTEVVVNNYASDGGYLDVNDFTGTGKESQNKGLYALNKAELFNLLCIPPYLKDGDIDTSLVGNAAAYCELRRAMLLVDPPISWRDKDTAKGGVSVVGTNSKNAALFFPRLKQPNPLRDNQLEDFVPCGAIAGIFARTDTNRGVWKAPAGLEATINGAVGVSVPLTDAENGELNPLGVNCLRTLSAAGLVIWGGRTLQGDDRLASEWKYIPVRRTALFIEETLYRGLQWVVFEPNDEELWSQIRLNVTAFMMTLYRRGAFQGATPAEAFFVQCDRDTNPQENINLGIVTVRVGFAPLKPAEFVIVQISQKAGQSS